MDWEFLSRLPQPLTFRILDPIYPERGRLWQNNATDIRSDCLNRRAMAKIRTER